MITTSPVSCDRFPAHASLILPWVTLILSLSPAETVCASPVRWTTASIGDVQSSTAPVDNNGSVQLAAQGNGWDSGYRFYHTNVAGNFDFKARLVSVDGNGIAGLAVRTTVDPGARYVAGVLRGDDLKSAKLPIWLRMTRYNDVITVYKSADAVVWNRLFVLPGIADNRGSWTILNMPESVMVGLAVTGEGGASATSTFDHISITELTVAYKTSWALNTFGSAGDFVQDNIHGMWVSPDGVCYPTCSYDEGGNPSGVYREVAGRPVRISGLRDRFGGMAVGGLSGKYVFYGGDSGVSRCAILTDGTTDPSDGHVLNGNKIRGIAVGSGELYVSDMTNNKIQVFDVYTLAPLRSWTYDRPGPIVVDKRGNLWIVHRKGDGNDGDRIDCYTPGSGSTVGTPITGKTIAGGATPTALCYDTKNDRLLVADNGPDQQIKAYAGLVTAQTDAPHLDESFMNRGTFGQKGGVWSGDTPGLIYDPKAGGYARFCGITGVGLDSEGNLYVAGNDRWGGSDLRKFDAKGAYKWSLLGVLFVQCGDFDPSSDGCEIYTQRNHIHMDYSKPTGKEWSYAGYMWGAFKYNYSKEGDLGPAVGGGPTMIRRIQGKLFMFRWGKVFRFVGETAVPCGEIQDNDKSQGGNGKWSVWYDSNGNGLRDPGETVYQEENGDTSDPWVDSDGDQWWEWWSNDLKQCFLRHYVCLGLDANGARATGPNRSRSQCRLRSPTCSAALRFTTARTTLCI